MLLVSTCHKRSNCELIMYIFFLSSVVLSGIVVFVAVCQTDLKHRQLSLITNRNALRSNDGQRLILACSGNFPPVKTSATIVIPNTFERHRQLIEPPKADYMDPIIDV